MVQSVVICTQSYQIFTLQKKGSGWLNELGSWIT